METYTRPISDLVTKMSNMCNIIVYYGYVHECALLFKQLCKKTRDTWDRNTKAVIGVIMKHKSCRFRMSFNSNFNQKVQKWLLEDKRYIYFSISILIKNGNNVQTATEFINSIED